MVVTYSGGFNRLDVLMIKLAINRNNHKRFDVIRSKQLYIHWKITHKNRWSYAKPLKFLIQTRQHALIFHRRRTGGRKAPEDRSRKPPSACTAVTLSPPAATQWYSLLLHAAYGAVAHTLLCTVNGNDSAVFLSLVTLTFYLWPPNSTSGEIFVQRT